MNKYEELETKIHTLKLRTKRRKANGEKYE